MIKSDELVWWRTPGHILFYFSLECLYRFRQLLMWWVSSSSSFRVTWLTSCISCRLRQHVIVLCFALFVISLHFLVRGLAGSHQQVSQTSNGVIFRTN